ncbi:MAG: glycosyltransferase family 2 protein [Candidatus Aenigmarchaeota archaeon]|nr:glycosyltransferase family 2 protein [Candidatus Aenigmarchaeota archaeon]
MNPIMIVVWIGYITTLYFLVYWLLIFFEKKDIIKKDHETEIKLSSYPEVSVLVPAYNEERSIRKTLESIIELEWPKNRLKIIVINDGSTDKTKHIVNDFIKKHRDFDIKLLNQKNSGKATSLNNGLDIIRSKYFACLDADSFVLPGTLKKMIYWHEKDANLAITTPVMKVHEPKTITQKFQRLEYISGMLLAKLMSYIDCLYIAPGPFSVYKTAIIKELGGFDTNSMVEDQEIAYRVQVKHYKIMQVPHAYVKTIAPSNMKGLYVQRNRWFKGSLINLIKYKKLIFNSTYGDFGVFQLPLNILAYIVAWGALVTFFYYSIKPFFDRLYELWLVGFDIMPYLQNFEWKIDLFAIEPMSVFFVYLMLAFSVLFLYLSSRVHGDKVRKYGWVYILPYFFLYFIIMSYIMVRVVLELLIGKKQKW